MILPENRQNGMRNMAFNNVEILAPAGSVAGMQAAFRAGADACYIGGNLFGARAFADNPGEEDLLRAIDEAHVHGKKLYLTVNRSPFCANTNRLISL